VNAPLRPLPLSWVLLAALAASLAFLLLAMAITGAQGGSPFIRSARASEPRCKGDTCTEFLEMEVHDVVSLDEVSTHAVVLVTKDRAQVLPVFVDEGAAIAIAHRLAHRVSPYPQAQDLLDSMLTQLGGRLTEVRIDSVDGMALAGRVLITQGKKHLDLPARASDSISLALAHKGKIFASRKVLASAGLTRADIDMLKQHPIHPPGDGEGPGTGGSGPPDPGEGPPDRRGAPELRSEPEAPIRL